MNDDLRQLARQLEQATAGPDAPKAALDPQTASLREAWLAFGQLLEAATSTPGALPEAMPWTPPRGHRRWLLPAALAMAASLLVALTVAWGVSGHGPLAGPGGAPKEVASNGGKHIGPTPAPEPISPTVSPAAAPAVELAWDDTLDSEIVSAGRAVVSVGHDWLGRAAGSTAVPYGLSQLNEDLRESPL
jgi:hypothetical protein